MLLAALLNFQSIFVDFSQLQSILVSFSQL